MDKSTIRGYVTQLQRGRHTICHTLCNGFCMTKYETNEIAATGLRYTLKEGGSPFQGMGSNGEIRSCMKCGQHKPRSKGAIHRFLNGQMFFCFECKPPKLPQ